MKERKDVHNLPENDRSLELYAIGVAEMKTRPATDPTSGYYQAAMLGFFQVDNFWADVGVLPSDSHMESYWNQCIHGSWFFAPWHRMYIACFESILANILVDLGKIATEDDWALPFWNYSDTDNSAALFMPSAFLEPEDKSNPLWIKERNSPPLIEDNVSLEKLNIIPFVNEDMIRRGFGGAIEEPSQFDTGYGGLEERPHDWVHDDIGGAMANPVTSGLDPIFWLHHCNIDRLWQEWLDLGEGRKNPDDKSFNNQRFVFYTYTGVQEEMIVEKVLDTTDVLTGYTYQESNSPIPSRTTRRLTPRSRPLELVAASNTKQDLGKTARNIQLTIPASIISRRQDTLAVLNSIPDTDTEAYLYFENITGKGVTPIYKVYVNTPDSGAGTEECCVGRLSLFGLDIASTPSIHHSGCGLSRSLDISELFDCLRTQPGWNPAQLSVRLEPTREVPADTEVNIGRISLHC